MLPLLLAPLGWCLSGAEHAQAQTPSCQISSFSPPTFGEVNVLTGSAMDAIGSVSVSCQDAGSYTGATVCVQIGPGSEVATAPDRVLVDAQGNRLGMNFHSGVAIWGQSIPTTFGDGAVQIDVALANGAGTSDAAAIKATIAGGQATNPVGLYSNGFDLSYYYLFYGGSKPDCNAMSGYTGPIIDRTFTTEATVPKRCEVSATNMDFGILGLLTRQTLSESSVSVKCSNGIPYEVGLGNGNNATSPQERRMKNAATGETIRYELHQDSARSIIWGGVGQSKPGTGTAILQSMTVYGRIPMQSPSPTPGTYTDTVVITVTY